MIEDARVIETTVRELKIKHQTDNNFRFMVIMLKLSEI